MHFTLDELEENDHICVSVISEISTNLNLNEMKLNRNRIETRTMA